jgi:hypothetical protein
MANRKNMTNLTPSPLEPKKPTSPWVWVGLGCGITALIAFGGCVGLGILGQRAVEEFNKPVDPKEAIAKLGDIPIYQPSTFNELSTKSARLGGSIVPGALVSIVSFDTSDPPNQVMKWYEQKLADKGYRKRSVPSVPDGLGGLTQVHFQRQTEDIMVQTMDASTNSRKDYSFTLARMKRSASQQK